MTCRLVPLATAALLLAAAAASACGSSSPTNNGAGRAGSAAPSPAKTPGIEELKKGLLTLSDMPTGYIEKRTSATGASGSPMPADPATPTSKEDACNRLFAQLDSEGGAGKTEGTASAVFVKSDSAKGPIITHTVQTYRDAGLLRQDMATVRDAVTTCTHFTDKEDRATVAFDTVSFPKLGEETEAFRVSATGPFIHGKTATLGGYFVAVRLGNVVSSVSSIGLPTVDLKELETVARKATEKVTPIAT